MICQKNKSIINFARAKIYTAFFLRKMDDSKLSPVRMILYNTWVREWIVGKEEKCEYRMLSVLTNSLSQLAVKIMLLGEYLLIRRSIYDHFKLSTAVVWPDEPR